MNLCHVTKFSPYFPFTLYCFYTKISSFMPVLTTGIVQDCFYLRIFYSEKFSTCVLRFPFAVIVNLSDKSQNQEILSTFSQPYPCVSSFRPFFRQISLPFHKLQLVKSPSFYLRETWKWYPFLGGASLCGPLKGVRLPTPTPPPPDDFKARTDWILVSLRTALFTDSFIPVLPFFAPSARSSGSITDVLDLQTLQRENGSVLSVKTRWNNREEGDDINEPCNVFHRCAVNVRAVTFIPPLSSVFDNSQSYTYATCCESRDRCCVTTAWHPGFWT